MKIDDIIRKCIEIPGVSIKRSDFNAELLMKTKEGKGSMTFFPTFLRTYYCVYFYKFSDMGSIQISVKIASLKKGLCS